MNGVKIGSIGAVDEMSCKLRFGFIAQKESADPG